MTPLLALVYGPLDAVAIMMITVMVGGMQMIPGAIPYATKRDLVPIMVACILVTPLGTYALVTGDPDVMRRFIGGFVLISALVMLRGWSYSGARNARISFAAGVVSGLANGAGGGRRSSGDTLPDLFGRTCGGQARQHCRYVDCDGHHDSHTTRQSYHSH